MVDNSIAMMGQPKEEATNPTKATPKQETQELTRADQSMKGETSETGFTLFTTWCKIL